MGARPSRRPGIRFESRAQPLASALPRMDVAAFVGFAATGPIDTPVAVEDVQQYTEVFGDDPPLGWDPVHGQWARGQLGAAVRAFFQNGGVRCWVVRVARDAAINRFPVPGLARLAGGVLTPAFLQARCEGSWSDTLTVGAALGVTPVEVSAVRFDAQAAPRVVTLNAADDVQVGDLLRLTERDITGQPLWTVLVPVLALQGTQATLAGDAAVWLGRGEPPAGSVTAAWFPLPATSDETAAPAVALQVDGLVWSGEDTAVLSCNDTGDATQPGPGHLVRIDRGSARLWLLVDEVTTQETGSPAVRVRHLRGQVTRLTAPPPALASATRNTRLGAERLRLDLWVERGAGQPLRLGGLGLAPGHPQYLGALPTDRGLYGPPPGDHTVTRATAALLERVRNVAGDAADLASHHAALHQTVSSPRFPLAADPLAADAFVPLGLTLVPKTSLGALVPAGEPLDRDGLRQFSPALFLDPELGDEPLGTLLGQAEFLREQSTRPRALSGIHAVLSVAEAALVAVPDAAQRSWLPEPTASVAIPPRPTLSATRPDAQRRYTLVWTAAVAPGASYVLQSATTPDFAGATIAYRGANTQLEVTATSAGRTYWRVRILATGTAGAWSNNVEVASPTPHFDACMPITLEAPALTATPPDASGSYRLDWSAVAGTDVLYVLEEAAELDFAQVSELLRDAARSLTIHGRAPGSRCYRVRAEMPGRAIVGPWSAPIVVAVTVPPRAVLTAPEHYAPQTLLPVQRALLRVCAARADLLAVLSLPEHYRERDALLHVTALREQVEEPALSYGALFHPWLVSPGGAGNSATPRSPPDGAVCGMMARRALARGAWIAPANEPLRGVVALTPVFARERQTPLEAAHVNLVRQEPGGFLTWCADTLARDPELTPIHIRRLLILLRRAALSLGPSYVFEPNNDAFRRQVERGFDALLGDLHRRGAFAGDTRERAYQVSVDTSVDPAAAVEQGRFVVELKVAPAEPLTFLTVRLIQSGERGVVTEAR